jgi:hypothetical protein
MATATKIETLSLRMTTPEKEQLESAATLCGTKAGPLAEGYIKEGLRRDRFPVVDFRAGMPGRVAYVSGTRWPVWMVLRLHRENGGDINATAKAVHRPSSLVRLALAYAEAYPEDMEASLKLHDKLDFEGLKAEIPELEQL